MRRRCMLPWSTVARNFNTTSKDFNAVKDPAELFFNPDVQARLKTLTGRDENRIFNPKKLGKRLSSPKYEFMTKAQLEEALKDSQKKMDIKLQMPPLLSARQEINEVITADPELKGLDDSKFVFTDISLGVPERKRLVVVRDPEGTLRKATWEERERMLQIYFPRPGREILPPPMFNEDNLKRLLEKKSYIFILDRACAQFEPDDPQYIHVTRDTYSHIEKHEDFDLLWSTRHYGPMVLYLTIEKRIDSLIKTLLMNLKREDIADLIQLYNFVHHGFSLTTTVEDDMALLKEYIEKDSLKRHQLELALQSYQEYLKQNQEIEKSRVSA
ncbi:small ribosomal subunit protein mS22-like [Artemia franciscana]|uniref:small ribosomal subunit protein mS22-like n=1 Tax=Artemia franciscana TaxID=6661 RepID=UPI0032DAD599